MSNFWTQTDLEKLKEIYPDMLTSEVAKILGRSKKSIYSQANLLGLKKSEAFTKSEASGRMTKARILGAAFHFPKGHEPWNKGQKGLQIGGVHTQFKKGNLPSCTLYDGAISIRHDKSGKMYKHIRISKAKWVLLHRYIWKQNFGEIPKGKIVRFKDGNSMNCTIDNLELITRVQNMENNTIHRYPDELKKAIRLKVTLNKTIKKYEYAE